MCAEAFLIIFLTELWWCLTVSDVMLVVIKCHNFHITPDHPGITYFAELWWAHLSKIYCHSPFSGKAFSAGGDLDWLIERHEQSDKKEENSKTMVQFYKMFLSLRDIPCPVIAAINGHAVGAGEIIKNIIYII